MFVLDKAPRFTHVVTVSRPVDGGQEKDTLKATFEVIGDEELATFDVNERPGQTALVRRVFVGFEDVLDASKQPVPFNDATRDALIDIPFVRAALAKAYIAGLFNAQMGN